MMKTIKFIFAIVLTGLYFSCSTGTEKSDDSTNADTFGWSEQKKKDLFNECMERYEKKKTEEGYIDKEAYCNCLKDKITISITWEEKESPTYKTTKKIEEYSKICETLTAVSN